MEERVSFVSGGLKLAGVLHIPERRDPRERRPALLVLHGFGSNKDSGGSVATAKMFTDLGYAALRFDMPGCGESDGTRGRVICLEQVEDTKHALTFLAARPEVDPDRIGVIGQSFGAAVAVYTAGVDTRVAACISSGGWGDGVKKFKKQHESPEAWARFTAMMEDGRRKRDRGETLMVPRYDIVPIPAHLRNNLSTGSIMEFPFGGAGRGSRSRARHSTSSPTWPPASGWPCPRLNRADNRENPRLSAHVEPYQM